LSFGGEYKRPRFGRSRCGSAPSWFGVHYDVGHVRLRVADVVFEPAREFVGVGQPGVISGDDGDEHDESAAGVQEPQLTRGVTGAVYDQLGDALSLAFV
jgi:hypothetical protein